MEIKNRAFKIISYIFIAFITILIAVSFGMPNFMGTNVPKSQRFAGRVNDRYITHGEVERAQRTLSDRFQGMNLPSEQMKGQALQQVINEKIWLELIRESGLHPRGSARAILLKDAYRQAHQQLVGEGEFSAKKVRAELRRRGTSTTEFEASQLRVESIEQARNVLSLLSSASERQVLDRYKLKNSSLSLNIAKVTKDQQDKILKQRMQISEKQIQKKFKEKYLKDDPEAKLTDIRREAIREDFFKKNREELLHNWLAELNKQAVTPSALKNNWKAKFFKVNNLSLDKNLSSKLPKASLSDLESHPEFFKEVFTRKLGSTIGPLQTENNVYLVRIKNRNIVEINESTTQQAQAKQELKRQLRQKHYSSALQSIFELARQRFTVERYQ